MNRTQIQGIRAMADTLETVQTRYRLIRLDSIGQERTIAHNLDIDTCLYWQTYYPDSVIREEGGN